MLICVFGKLLEIAVTGNHIPRFGTVIFSGSELLQHIMNGVDKSVPRDIRLLLNDGAAELLHLAGDFIVFAFLELFLNFCGGAFLPLWSGQLFELLVGDLRFIQRCSVSNFIEFLVCGLPNFVKMRFEFFTEFFQHLRAPFC